MPIFQRHSASYDDLELTASVAETLEEYERMWGKEAGCVADTSPECGPLEDPRSLTCRIPE